MTGSFPSHSQALIAITLLFATNSVSATITGYIDNVYTTRADGPLVSGWSCDTGVARSIEVHLYVGGPAGMGGTFLTKVKADLASEAAITSICGTPTGTRHRFRIPITREQVLRYGNQPIYVHGISQSGGPNSYIYFSGFMKIPEPAIKGNIDSVTFEETQLKIRGWACQYAVSQAIQVQLFAGDPAGTGTRIASTITNLPSSFAIDSACGTKGVARRFEFNLSANQYRNHAGKTIFIHGIRATGSTANASIAGSGEKRFPNVVISTLSQKLAGLSPGSDVTIAENERLIIDRHADVGILRINGQLACPTTGSFEIRTHGILVEGQNAVFECGSESNRFLGDLSIRLKPGRELVSHHPMGQRAIAAHMGGTIRLFGDGKRAGWRRIAATIDPGQTIVRLSSPAADWSPGDRIVVGPTGFKFDEADERIITAIDSTKKIITVDRPFSYRHIGVALPYSNGSLSWNLDERAEVANLTRNIRIQPTGAEEDLDEAKIGAHMMIMVGSYGYIDGVEFIRMGQMGILGRYPFHWHLAGHVPGQFIRNSSIRNSYQRCVSVHGTHEASVINNVCYNHFGHGFFLENGSETGNSIVGNLSMVSRRIPQAKALLASDFRTSDHSRFSPSSGFWISNPDNIVRGNVASGAQGTGFWMSFSQSLRCNSSNHCEVGGAFPGYDIYPARTATRVFSNNVAHSADVGINWDGAADGAKNNPLNPMDREIVASHYFYDAISNPSPKIPVFDRIVVFKNRRTGIYFRGNSVEFPNLIAADNADSLFFAYNQIVRNSLIVGLSANTTNQDLEYLRNYLRPFQPIHGVRLYDGPFELINVHFADFPTARLVVGGSWDATPVPFYAIGGFGRFLNSTRGLSFAPRPLRKFDFETQERARNFWQDSVITSAIRDLDGTLAGVPGSIIRPDRPLNWDESCTRLAGEAALRCRYKIGILHLGLTGLETGTYTNLDFAIKRSDGPSMEWDGSHMFGKAGLIVDADYTYKVTFAPGVVASALRVSWDTHLTEMSPVIEMSGLKPTCNLAVAYQITNFGQVYGVYSFIASSMSQLMSLTTIPSPVAVFPDTSTGKVYMRFYSNAQDPLFNSPGAAAATTHRLDFICP